MYMTPQPMVVQQQPMMMMQPQPMMMMQPQPMMMMQPPPPPQPQQIVINVEDSGDCPRCSKGKMYASKAWTAKTCCVCIVCWPALLCDFAWGLKRICPDCQYEVTL